LSVNTVIELDVLDRMVVLSDAGMLIKPTLAEKAAMIENASVCASKIRGIKKPKAAVLCAVEVVNEAMPDTIDAALLAKMSDRGQIKGAIVDGPLGMDNALSKKAAEIKGISSEVAGDADILIVPDIETGNILVKSITYIAKTANASYIHGAKVPILAPSRSDGKEVKFHSILLAMYMAG
jgi:phosphate butyryltransferase